MPTIDEDLNQMEKDIRQLKVEYDQYFGGGRKRPPTEIEWRIDLILKRYTEHGGDLSTGQRFRFNNLTQSYAKYREVFRKRFQQREEGTVQHHYGAAARVIEAQRERRQTETAARAATPPGPPMASSFRIACSDPEHESEKVQRLYDELLRAKYQAGESVGRLNRDNFCAFLSKQTKELRQQKGCKEVEFVVETADGRVKLKAVVKA
jgi:hypothetical protein